MNESWQKILTYLGIIAAVYILFKFILPIFFKMLGFIFTILMWGAIAFVLFLLISYILNLLKK